MAELVASGKVSAKIFPHPLNAWYAVAWDHEVSAKGLMSRTVAGKPMALYRTKDGRPVALANACWHRLARLSMGKLVGNDEVHDRADRAQRAPSSRPFALSIPY